MHFPLQVLSTPVLNLYLADYIRDKHRCLYTRIAKYLHVARPLPIRIPNSLSDRGAVWMSIAQKLSAAKYRCKYQNFLSLGVFWTLITSGEEMG